MFRFLNHFVNHLPDHCAILARAEVKIRGLNIHPEFVPAHFNLICTRIVPDPTSPSKITSINLRGVKRLILKSEFTAEVTLMGEGGDQPTVEFKFERLVELYSLYMIIKEILSYTGRDLDIMSGKEEKGETEEKAEKKEKTEKTEKKGKKDKMGEKEGRKRKQ